MLTLFLIVFVDLVGFGIIIPLLPFYGEYYQASPDVVTLLMATYSITQLISAPILGRLSDKLGRRPILLFSLLGSVLSYVWLGVADSLLMLFAARAFNGLMAGNIATAFAYVADITTAENRAKGMGVIGAAFGLGFIAGPAIGGILAGPDAMTANYQLPAFCAAGLSAVAMIIALVALKESLSPEERASHPARTVSGHWKNFFATLKAPQIGLLIGLTFLSTFVFAGMETTFAMWSHRAFNWGPLQNGYLFAYLGLVSAAIQGGGIGKLVKRYGEKNLIAVGAAFLGAGLATLPFCSNLPLLMAATTLMAIGFSLTTPTLSSLISLEVSKSEHGTVMGASRSASTMARALGPIFAGVLFANLGRDMPYFVGAVLMAFLVVLTISKVHPSTAKAKG